MIDIVYNLDSDIKSRDTMEFHRPHRPQTQPPRPICPNCDVVCWGELETTVPYTQRVDIRMTRGKEDEDTNSEHLPRI